MKNKIINLLLVFMLITGIVLIFINPIQSMLIKRSSTEHLAVSAEEIKQNETKDASFDFAAVQSLTVADVLNAQLNMEDVAVIGSIAIPNVNLQIPIIKGVGEDALSVGAGTMKADQKLGEGNYALASHYIENKDDILFGPLYHTNVGDLIYVTNKEEVFVYEISSIDIINATDVHVIADVKDEARLTLITCAEDGVKRMSVVATFVEKQPFEQVQDVF